jgi:hypothetical protein
LTTPYFRATSRADLMFVPERSMNVVGLLRRSSSSFEAIQT